ncbi:MAG: type II toxin-antitoxin system death-on-curing family toxin [Flavobacteriales bacterium]|nr:type II toxin-antitoxin system death-on-curing family toxin [Flavobacteriales bacterium]
MDNIAFLHAWQIEHMHRALVKDFRDSSNPVDPPGVKSQTNLESAAFRPQTSNGDTRKYSSVQSSAAALAHSLTNNHAFHNGNKRTALVALIVHLYSNGYTLTCDDNQLFEIILESPSQVLTEETDEYHFDRADEEVHAISKWIRDNSRPLEKGERAINFGELVRLLNKHGCTSQNHGSGKSKTQVTRTVRPGAMVTTSRMVVSFYGVQTPDGDPPGTTSGASRRYMQYRQ